MNAKPCAAIIDNKTFTALGTIKHDICIAFAISSKLNFQA
jgi:hypothetical protein